MDLMVKFCQTYSITSPVLFTKLYRTASAYHVISEELVNQIFRYNWFLDTHASMNNPHWKSSRIFILLCKYYIVISDTLAGFFLDGRFLLVAVILSDLHEKPRRKKAWVTEKVNRQICVRNITFLTARTLFYAFFCYFLPLLLSPSEVT